MNRLITSENVDSKVVESGQAFRYRKRAPKRDQWPRCSPELVEILLMLRHPAWVESAAGEIFFFNKSRLSGVVLEQHALQTISRQTPCGVPVQSITSGANRASLLSAVAFPVICALAGNLRIVVACAPGEEADRDGELTQALWGKLLKAEDDGVFDPRLSVQQKLVYRLFRRGMSYKEMAGALGVAHATIRVHVAAIRKILGNGQVPVLRRGGGRSKRFV